MLMKDIFKVLGNGGKVTDKTWENHECYITVSDDGKKLIDEDGEEFYLEDLFDNPDNIVEYNKNHKIDLEIGKLQEKIKSLEEKKETNG